MGSNQSLSGEPTLYEHTATKGDCQGDHSGSKQRIERQTKSGSYRISGPGVYVDNSNGKPKKAKPSPPQKPKVLDVSYSTITLAWQPPRHGISGVGMSNKNSNNNNAAVIAYTVEMMRLSSSKNSNSDKSSGHKGQPGHWATLTRTCQSATYTARGLDGDATYTFRVRAENVYGTGKPSARSDPRTTRIYEMADDCFTPPIAEEDTDTAGAAASLFPPLAGDEGIYSSPMSFSYHPSSKACASSSSSLMASRDRRSWNSSSGHISSDNGDGVCGTDIVDSDLGLRDNQIAHNSHNTSTRGLDDTSSYVGSRSSACEGSLYNSEGRRVRRRHSFSVPLNGSVVTKVVSHCDASKLVVSPTDSMDYISPISTTITQSQSCHASFDPTDNQIQSMSTNTYQAASSSDHRTGPGLYDRTNSFRNRDAITRRGSFSSQASPSTSSSLLFRKNSCSGARTSENGHHVLGLSTSGRKISLPILLPGTGTDSLTRLRESRTSLRENESNVRAAGQGQGHSHQSRCVVGSREVISGSTSTTRHHFTPKVLSNGGADNENRIFGITSTTRNSLKSTRSDVDRDVKRDSQASVGSGGSGHNSSAGSMEDSTSSMSSSSTRDDIHTNLSSTKTDTGVGTMSGSLSSLGKMSFCSNATLSNSKNGSSKDSLSDVIASSTGSRRNSTGDDGVEDSFGFELTQDLDRIFGRMGSSDGSESKTDNQIDADNGEELKHLNLKNKNESNICNKANISSKNMNKIDIYNDRDDDHCHDIYKLKEELKNLNISEDRCQLHEQSHSHQEDLNYDQQSLTDSETYNINTAETSGTPKEKTSYYASLENPWEKDTSANGHSEHDILSRPYCDDIKVSLYAREIPDPGQENPDCYSYSANKMDSSLNNFDNAEDFRTLRSVLQSSSMVVKAQRFSPEVVGVVVGEAGQTCRTLTRARYLATIADVDEEEDPVRITTL